MPAATVSWICFGLRAPAIALVIAGSRSAQASTSCATLMPRRAAIGRRPSTSCRFFDELRLLEERVAAAPVVGAERGGAFPGERAGQQAGLHRAVGDDADAVGRAPRQDLGLDLAPQHAVGRLQRRDRADRLRALELRQAEVADAGVAHLAGVDQLADGRPAFLDLLVRLGPVDLVEIDRVDLQAAQAGVALGEHALAPQRLADLAAVAFPTRPHLVATITSSRRPAIACATSSSEWPCP